MGAAPMDELLDGLYQSHRLLLVLAAVGYFAYWTRSRLSLPRHAHVTAAASLLVGVAVLLMTPPDAPVNNEPLGWVKKGAMLAVFPALVYFFFLFTGAPPAPDQHLDGAAAACHTCGSAPGAGRICPDCSAR